MKTKSILTGSVLIAILTMCLVGGGSASATLLTTYVTGDAGPTPTIFTVTFDPTVVDSGGITATLTHPTDPTIVFDGIDFDLSATTVPGRVAVGDPSAPGSVQKANVFTSTFGVAYVPNATLIAPAPPPAPRAWVSTILTSPSFPDYIYYVENQFGFAAGAPQRIMRHNVLTGLEDVVYNGAASGQVNFEGLEIVSVGATKRLFFFARDPGDATKRALMAIDLTAGGVAVAGPAAVKMSGLFANPSGDGSDEMDYDPVNKLIFGTNIRNGEVIAYDPIVDAPITSPGAAAGRFIDGTEVAGGAADGLGLLGRQVDGIRSTGSGQLVFVGRGGVMGAIDIAGVLANGADNGDVIRLYDSTVRGTGYIFDDLTPLSPARMPEPSVVVAWAIGGLTWWGYSRRSRRQSR